MEIGDGDRLIILTCWWCDCVGGLHASTYGLSLWSAGHGAVPAAALRRRQRHDAGMPLSDAVSHAKLEMHGKA